MYCTEGVRFYMRRSVGRCFARAQANCSKSPRWSSNRSNRSINRRCPSNPPTRLHRIDDPILRKHTRHWRAKWRERNSHRDSPQSVAEIVRLRCHWADGANRLHSSLAGVDIICASLRWLSKIAARRLTARLGPCQRQLGCPVLFFTSTCCLQYHALREPCIIHGIYSTNLPILDWIPCRGARPKSAPDTQPRAEPGRGDAPRKDKPLRARIGWLEGADITDVREPMRQRIGRSSRRVPSFFARVTHARQSSTRKVSCAAGHSCESRSAPAEMGSCPIRLQNSRKCSLFPSFSQSHR